MNQTPKLLIMGTMLILINSACNIRAEEKLQPGETAAATSTLTAASPSETPTQPATSTPQVAPTCALPGADIPAPAQCKEITAQESSVFCTNKKPFNIIFINKGNTYKTLTDGFYCTDGGVQDNKQIITCTGIMAANYQVQVCDPACVIPTLEAASTQCPQNYQYDSQRGCCTNGFVLLRQNCRVFEFKTSTCKVDCSAYTTKKECTQNIVACIWIPDKKECIGRK